MEYDDFKRDKEFNAIMAINVNLNPQGVPGLGRGPGGSNQSSMMMMMAMMQWVMQLLSTMMGMGGMAGGAPMMGDFGQSPAGGNGISNFLGGPGGSAPAGYGAPGAGVPTSYGPPGAPGSGQAAVDLARGFLGQDSIGLKGRMPNFTAAGGVTNNCADFVSAALESQGLLQGHHVNVNELERQLQRQGYRRIPASQAQPGDVFINNSRGHTELVATAGARTLIGSNGDARQRVSEHQNNPGSGVYYTRR